MPQLDLTTYPSQIFWLVVSFCALYLLVKYIVQPRLDRIQDARWERQDNNFKRAQELQAEADSLVRKAEGLLSKAREESSALLAEVESRLHTQNETALQKLNAEIQKSMHQAEQRLAEQKQVLLKEANTVANEVVEAILQTHFSSSPTQIASPSTKKTTAKKTSPVKKLGKATPAPRKVKKNVS